MILTDFRKKCRDKLAFYTLKLYNVAVPIESPSSIQELPLSIIKNMIVLSTSGFGLVVALAWNQLIQKLVDTYITPYFGKNGGLVSLFIYAFVVTLIAIVVIMQLTGVQRKLETLEKRRELVKERQRELRKIKRSRLN